jgi:signal transduction histidine kinase
MKKPKSLLNQIEKQRAALLKRLSIYIVALALPSLALLAKTEISSVFEHGRYFLHFAAIVLVSLYGGLGPGLVAIAISVLGSYFFVLRPMHPIRDELQYSYLLLLLFTSVSLLTAIIAAKLRQSMQTAKDAVAARSELMAIVSHDLKNPLAAILLKRQVLLRLLDRGDCDFTAIRRQVDSLGSSADQMNRLIRDILDMETIEAGHLKVARKAEDLQLILQSVSELFAPIAENKTIQLEVQPLNIPVRVDCDRDRILQVLSNLIGNAIKFTAEGGQVEVGTQLVNGSQIEISVRDNGPGIRRENIEKLFHRHWQAEGTARLGHGLGLFITKGIVEAHEGQVRVESTLGQGSTFCFTLKLAAEGSENATNALPKLKAQQTSINSRKLSR